MISVRYVAPLMRTEGRPDHTCHLDPYTMLSPRQGSMPYVVQVEYDDQQTGLMEGDQLIVDEKRIPRAGDIGIYGASGALYACVIYENKGILCPVGYEKLNGEQVIFVGAAIKLVRLLN